MRSSGAVLVAQSHHLLLHHEVAAHQQPGRSRLVQPAEGSDLAGHADRRHHRQDRQRARFRAPVQAQSSQLRRTGPTPGYANLVKALFCDDEMIFISWSGSRKPLARIPLGLYINEVKKWPHCDLASKTIATWVSASAYELSQFYSIFQLPTILPIL